MFCNCILIFILNMCISPILQRSISWPITPRKCIRLSVPFPCWENILGMMKIYLKVKYGKRDFSRCASISSVHKVLTHSPKGEWVSKYFKLAHLQGLQACRSNWIVRETDWKVNRLLSRFSLNFFRKSSKKRNG